MKCIDWSWAQSVPYDYHCAEGDMRCLRADIYRLDLCPITFKKMALSSGGNVAWYVSTDRGGGWAPVDEFYERHDAMLRARGSPIVTEMLDVWNGDSGADEVNACEHTHFWQCYTFRNKGDLAGCKEKAKVEQYEHIADTIAAADARARAAAQANVQEDIANQTLSDPVE